MVREAIARRRLPELAPDVRHALVTAAWTRLLVWAVAVAAAALVGVHASNEASFDVPALTHPFGGGLADSLFAPLARWDAVWYLGIAHQGYGGDATAFFPEYPLIVRGLVPTGAPGGLLVMSYAVSLAAFAGALVLLGRLAALELRDAAAARLTVLLIALFPGALWFGAPYSESLFLLLSVAAFYLARTDRWALAGLVAGFASATRSAGIVLALALVLLWWSGGGRRLRDLAWVGLAPLGLVAYSVYLELKLGDGFAYLHLQEVWFRSFAGPFAGAWDGLVAAFDGVRQIASGQRAHVYFTAAGGDPLSVAWHNVELFAFLVAGAVAVVGVLRRLPLAYGAYVLAALALPLSFPVGPQPLMSLPRFLAVLFPLFMWLALVLAGRPVLRRAVLAVFAVYLVAFAARFGTWHWVA